MQQQDSELTTVAFPELSRSMLAKAAHYPVLTVTGNSKKVTQERGKGSIAQIQNIARIDRI